MSVQDWHALLALGTNGGQPLTDGDQFAAGVHLLWSIRPELGFPRGGYHIWRRRHRDPEWACFDIGSELLPPPGGVLDWEWVGFRLRANPGPVRLDPDGCGKLDALHFPGRQDFEVRSPSPAAVVTAAGAGSPPLVEVLVLSDGEAVVATRTRARAGDGGGWSVRFWVDGAIGIRFSGDDLRICMLCFGIADRDGGWSLLSDEALLLPVVRPNTRNDPAHLHGPAATHDEAAARLSATLAPPTGQRLATEFTRDLGGLVEDLLLQGRDATLPETATAAASGRTPPRLGMATAGLLALAALDPDISRMLGLYWHDPVPDGTWDYRVVAHHGPVRYPGRRVTFEQLPVGTVATATLLHQGIAFTGNGGLQVLHPIRTSTRQPALRVQAPRAGTVAGMRLDPPVPALTLRLSDSGAADVPVVAWRAGAQVAAGLASAGPAGVTLEHGPGIDAVTWTDGPFDLLGVELLPQGGLVGDLVAHAWHLGPERPDPVRALRLTGAAGAAEPTRLHPDGSLERTTGVVGLDWEVAGGGQDVRQPLRVLVARAWRGDGPAPVPGDRFELRNLDRPALACARSPAPPGPPAGPEVPRRWTERVVPEGWHAWRVRGIDAFGRLGPWSEEREVRLALEARPPPPDRVLARYLDPADPHLRPPDRALAEADGAGLLVEWTWPAERRIQAPRVEPDGEFRVLLRRGDPNLLQGSVLATDDRGGTSRLDTDLDWPGDTDALAGELLRVGGASFQITANGRGPGAFVEVRHLAAPTRRPATGAFTIRLSESGRLHTDLGDPHSFDRRLHAEPVGRPVALASRVDRVEDDGGQATVLLADPLPPAGDDVLEGRLVSLGIAHPVSRQAPGSALVGVEAVAQADGSTALPVAGQPCTVWAGAAYRAWLPGLRLEPAEGAGLAVALVAVTTSDGDQEVADDPVWSRPGRGELGGRPGRESRASRVARVSVPRRTQPPPVEVERPPEQDGDIPADQAEPADWYGRARYTLGFPPVAAAAGYRVLRASTAALFTTDRGQRQSGTGPYADGPFDDEGASEAWLAEHFPSLTVADLLADLATRPDAPAIQAAWRAWMAWFYPGLRNKDVMALAELAGNEEAFRPAHDGTLPAPPFRDVLDGRGLGRFVYRVRSVDASGNAGAWSAAFPLVELRDVTPPAPPVPLSALGDEQAVVLSWRTGGDPDLAAYRVWRARRAEDLADVRRRASHAEVPPATGALVQTWRDQGLVGLQDWYYRVAAVDRSGNVSRPTAVLKARPVDSEPPAPPDWVRVERVKRRARDGALLPPHAPEDPTERYRPAVALAWTAAEDGVACMLERRVAGERVYTARSGWLAPDRGRRTFAWVDDGVDPGREASYRVRPRDAAGNEQRYAWNPTLVPPLDGPR